MSTEISKEQEQDFFDYWHLQYEGDLSLEEFMIMHAHWTDMDRNFWETTGEFHRG